MTTFTVSVLIWGIGVITGRMFQYYIDGRRTQ